MGSISWHLATSAAHPKSGTFPPPALPGFPGTASLSATPDGRACPSRASRWELVLPPLGFPVLRPISCCQHAVALTPVGPQAGSGCSPGTWDSGLPHPFAGSAPTLDVSRPAQRSRMLRPAGSRSRHKRPFPSEASVVLLPPPPLRLLPAGATVAGWELHPRKIDAFPRRTKGTAYFFALLDRKSTLSLFLPFFLLPFSFPIAKDLFSPHCH